MMFSITNIGAFRVTRGGGQICPINVTLDGCAATITTRYGAMDYSNIISFGHFPMTACLLEYDL